MESTIHKDEFITNIAGKVRNTRLPKNRALWPLFEIISNAVHAIETRRISRPERSISHSFVMATLQH